MDFQQASPAGYRAMISLSGYLQSTKLSTCHQDLIKIRASQVNGCAFCINLHMKDAIAHGETAQRICLLDAWRETSLFSPEERALLALTEEVTLISTHVSDETYREAAALFETDYLADILMAIITINAWNRIGITTQMQPA